MLRSSLLIVVSLVAFACSKEKAKDAPHASPPPPAAIADAASTGSAGSADMGSGSAMAGSGSADGSAAGSGSAMAEVPTGDFDKLSSEDKTKVMKQKVMPAMRAAFQKFDPKEFASFTCKTCHGKDPQKSKHEMPTADLPKLDFAKIKAGKVEPEWLEFMNKVVEPEMAKILGKPVQSATQDGFGCLDCHTEKK